MTAKALFDARDYEDIEGDWRCSVCLSSKDREEALADEAANKPAPSWGPNCEIGNAVRAERQRRLLACDWTQTLDAPLATAKVAQWGAYRQALRNLTTTYPDPSDVVWPTPPA
ncbi:tail fiber assembly protein [Brevundimonas sp.]|uniref:tail fiber assembly protein n=1 Tax=Brevundimonas sp. TaxID=1871086 RepID=UPI0035B4924E